MNLNTLMSEYKIEETLSDDEILNDTTNNDHIKTDRDSDKIRNISITEVSNLSDDKPKNTSSRKDLKEENQKLLNISINSGKNDKKISAAVNNNTTENQIKAQKVLSSSTKSINYKPDSNTALINKTFGVRADSFDRISLLNIINEVIDVKQDDKEGIDENLKENIDEAADKLPTPKLSVSHVKPGTISVEWHMTRLPSKPFKLTHYVITLVGCEFSNTVKSDASYECLMESNGKQVPAVQHCWVTKNNATLENKFLIDGILDTAIYHITVHAIYKHESMETEEYKKSSKTLQYTPLGPPHPPKLRVSAVDIFSATLEWLPQHYPRPEFITGYRLIVNGELSQIFEKNVNEFIFADMQPGRKYDIEIVTLTNSIVGQSQPSNRITLVCPIRPRAPLITQLPSVRPNACVIGWKAPDFGSSNNWDNVICYKVFLNKKYHGEIFSSNILSYSYMICDLVPGNSYEVAIQAFCGVKLTQPSEGPVVACLVPSDYSNDLMVTPSAPPDPPRLRVAAISSDGIEITWQFPQQYGDAIVSGFQLVRNGRCYDNIIPPDVSVYKLSEVELGETVNLQMISLTNHPVGKYTALHEHPNFSMDQPQREFLMNGKDDFEQRAEKYKKKYGIHPDYPGCKVGPILSVQYTGLVKPAVRVWTEKVTGYSAMVIYQTSRMNAHFLEPEYYLVSYWPGTTPDDNVITIKTDKDFVNLSNLNPTTIYTVQVESRRESKRFDDNIEGDQNEKIEYRYIIYSKSNQTQFQTASPPDPPTNLSVISTTCHAIKVCWDPPVDHGSELIATRVDCYPLNVEKPLHIFKELTADAKSCIIDSLSEKTHYRITVTAITEEYFTHHKIKEIKQLPKVILESMPWLPSAYIDTMTSGTDPATNLEWKSKHDKTIGITWKLPRVYGTNRLVNQILCYHEIGGNNGAMAVQIPLPSNTKGYKVPNLKIGSKYKIWLEAVVLIKLNIDTDVQSTVSFKLDDETKELLNSRIDHYKELKDTRCTNVLSEPLIMRVPAPCEPPIVHLTGYTSETIDIYWAKPSLYSQHKDPDNPEQKIHLYRKLIKYRLEVNGIRQRTLEANENICKLTKCKPLHTYNIVIVALTCLTSAAEDPNSLINNEVDIKEIDESHSRPLQVKTFAAERPNQISSICAQFDETVDPNEPESIGRIRIEWTLQDQRNVSQFNINWFSAEESLSKRKSFDADIRSCYVPVTKTKCTYEINLETVYEGSETSMITETLFIEVPGSPDAPDLWLKEQNLNNVSIQWSEPRVYPTVPVMGYQIYLNDNKVGAKLDKEILKATLPLKPNRTYKISIQALSSKPQYPDSINSNHLIVTTSMTNATNNLPNPVNPYVNGNGLDMLVARGSVIENSYSETTNMTQIGSLKKYYEDENDRDEYGEGTIPIRINKMSEDFIDIDWAKYVKHDGVNEFKIDWHCLNTNEHFEHRCLKNVSNFRIKKLKPGNTYRIRVSAIKNNNTVVTRSKNYILQTCAAPDSPVLRLRACNFKYITMEWNRPNAYGEAQIVGYKLYVDGKVEAVLSNEQTVFTLSKGEPCHEYSFQVQAMTSDENLASPISAPLSVIWPGVQVPNLRPIENENGILRLAWDEPSITGNAKISYYRVLAENEQTGKVLVQGPLDLNMRECEFQGIESGRYKIHLEINAYGLAEPFCSKSIQVDFGNAPEAPQLTVQIPGLEQRNKLDKIASSLANKRDRLLKLINLNQNNDASKHLIPKAMSTLRQLDEALNDCIKLIANYTGYFVINLNWSCQQTNPMVRILGFRVYVNGKQYGVDLHDSIRSIRVKLSLERPVHSIYVTTFTDRSRMESQSSNVIELLSENFFPFTFYCYNNIHAKNISWPEKGCCAYQDSLPLERLNVSRTREILNIGLLSEPIQALKCEVIDIASNKPRNLVDSRNKATIVVLFWTKWCLSSIRTLNYLVMYAKRNPTHSDYTACHTGNESTSEMLELLKRAGYLDTHVKFVNDVQYSGRRENTEVSSIEPFDIKGVPTIAIVNKSGLIVWKGRYCAYDFASFEAFMNHTLSEVNKENCPVHNCEICLGDTSIERELADLRTEQKYLNHYIDSLKRPTTEAWTTINQKQKATPKLPKISTRQLIAVKSGAYNLVRATSERGMQHTNTQTIMRSYVYGNKSRPSSTDSHGFCYYNKQAIKRF